MTHNETPKERPILFSAPMIRAILAGSKTQTRRIVKPQPPAHHWEAFKNNPLAEYKLNAAVHGNVACLTPMCRKKGGEWRYDEPHRAVCPYGADTDRLWVRETWLENAFGQFQYRADCEGEEDKGRGWKSPRFMPRRASRLLLEVVSVRVERLQQITEEDIKAEGAVARLHKDPAFGLMSVSAFDGRAYIDPRILFAAGWDKINGKTSPWADNPWVWVVEFKRVQP